MKRSYLAVEKDPEIDRFRTLYQKEHIRETDLAVLAGCAVATVKNMFGGKTRRPQHQTFTKLANAMGYRYDLVRDETPNYVKEIPKARIEFKEYRAHLAEKRKKPVKKSAVRARPRVNGNGVAIHG